MSNHELNELDTLLADKIMGWKLLPDNTYQNTQFMAFPPAPAFANCDNTFFRPTTNLNHTFLIIQKLMEYNYTVNINYTQDKISCRIITHYKDITTTAEDNLPEVICNSIVSLI